MTIRLRPHHLLCLLTYGGKGYSFAFTANLDMIAKRISKGEDILIVDGPDDICASLLGDAGPHCWRESVTERDRLAARDLAPLLTSPMRAGVKIKLEKEPIKAMRDAFAAGSTRAACLGCEWSDLCSSIAAKDYHGATVFSVR